MMNSQQPMLQQAEGAPSSGATMRRSHRYGTGGSTAANSSRTKKAPPPPRQLSAEDRKPGISGRLYMAPQATVRTKNRNQPASQQHQSKSSPITASASSQLPHSHYAHQPPQQQHYASTGTISLSQQDSAIKSGNTRRRRRSNETDKWTDGSGSAHNSKPASTMLPDRSPRMEHQDSETSLDLMAAVLDQDREESTAMVQELPPAPMLWADHDMTTTSILPSPRMTMRKKQVLKEHPSPEVGYHGHHPNQHHHHNNRRQGQHHRVNSNQSQASSNGKLKNSVARGLNYGHEDYSENNGMEDSFSGCDFEAGDPIPIATSSGNASKTKASSSSSTRTWNSWWWAIRTTFKGKKDYSTFSFHFSWNHCAQISILLILAIYVLDSHTKVQSHKNQLREYDEERAHILEQMMWIDQAAKKVHKKYSAEKETTKTTTSDQQQQQHYWGSMIEENNHGSTGVVGNNNEADTRALHKAQQDLQTIQHAIQLNARNYLASAFGGRPAEVSLQLSSSSSDERLLVGLSDDTPHAISTLVQQVNAHIWDEIQVHAAAISVHGETTNDILQLRPKRTTTTAGGAVAAVVGETTTTNDSHNKAIAPLLEFVERSHGCREPGSVSLQQMEVTAASADTNGDINKQDQPGTETETCLVLSVYLQGMDQSLPEGTVCIGRVLKGLEQLVDLQNRRGAGEKGGTLWNRISPKA